MRKIRTGIKTDHNFSASLKGLENKKRFVKKVYQILFNPNHSIKTQPLETRIQLVQYIESILGSEIRNTKELKRNILDFLSDCDFRRKDIATRIKQARKKLKLTQILLSKLLGYKSHVSINQFENGSRYPSKRVLQWLEKIGM